MAIRDEQQAWKSFPKHFNRPRKKVTVPSKHPLVLNPMQDWRIKELVALLEEWLAEPSDDYDDAITQDLGDGVYTLTPKRWLKKRTSQILKGDKHEGGNPSS